MDKEAGEEFGLTLSVPSLHATMQCAVGVSLGRAGLTGLIRSLIIIPRHAHSVSTGPSTARSVHGGLGLGVDYVN